MHHLNQIMLRLLVLAPNWDDHRHVLSNRQTSFWNEGMFLVHHAKGFLFLRSRWWPTWDLIDSLVALTFKVLCPILLLRLLNDLWVALQTLHPRSLLSKSVIRDWLRVWFCLPLFVWFLSNEMVVSFVRVVSCLLNFWPCNLALHSNFSAFPHVLGMRRLRLAHTWQLLRNLVFIELLRGLNWIDWAFSFDVRLELPSFWNYFHYVVFTRNLLFVTVVHQQLGTFLKSLFGFHQNLLLVGLLNIWLRPLHLVDLTHRFWLLLLLQIHDDTLWLLVFI